MPTTPARGAAFLAGVWLAVWLLTPLGASRVHAASAAPTPEALSGLEANLHVAVNAERADRGRVPLERTEAIDVVARAHSRDMARRGFLAHQTPEGRGPLHRIQGAGIKGFTLAAENVGLTSRRNPNREILDHWLRSREHRDALLAPAMNRTGIGIARAADGTLYYTQLYLSVPRD